MFEKVKALLVEDLRIAEEEVVATAEFANLGVNSLELADLIMKCEEEFGITIEDDDLGKFHTVQDLVDYLEAHAN